MTSGQPYRTALDMKKVEDTFMANLRQQIRLDEENYRANMTYLKTGQLPVSPLLDTRTVTEKLLDVERLKVELQKKLLTITDGFEANKIVQNLDSGQLRFLAQNFGPIQEAMKKLYSVGVLADIFIDYLNRYIDKFNQNQGLDNNLQQQAGINEILLNSRTILDQMANVNDVNRIIQKIRSTGNTNNMILDELARLRDFINVLPNIVNDINRTNNAIIQNDLDALLNMVANDLPTNGQLDEINRKLDVAIRARDNLALGQILDDLQGLIMSNDDIQMQMGILQRSIAQTNETTSAILQQMATKDDFTEIIRQLQQIKIQQIKTSPETKRIIKELTDMRKMVDILPTILSDINIQSNEQLKTQVNEILDLISNDMPTNRQLESVRVQLDAAIRANDAVGIDGILQQLAQLVDSNNDIRGRVEILQDNITQLKRDLKTGQAPEKEPAPINIKGPPPRLRGQPPDLSGKEDVSQLKPVNPVRTLGDDFYSNVQTLYSRGFASKDDMASSEQRAFITEALGVLEPILESPPGDIISKYSKNESSDIDDVWNPKLTKLVDYVMGILKDNLYPPSGRGVKSKKMKGRGITPRKYTSQVLPTDVDHSKGIKASAKFVPMGRHLINVNQLNKDIIAIKRQKGSVINSLPSQRVSRNLSGVIKKIIGGSLPTFDEINDLSEDEKTYLSKVANETQITDKISIPTPKKTTDEQDVNQFEILRGQILAGNDSNEVVKKFKSIILKLSNKNMIPKAQVRELLLDLTALGH